MMTVRPMTRRDIARVYEIEVQSFRSPWSKLSLLGEFHNNVAHYYVAEEEGRVIGMVTLCDMARRSDCRMEAGETLGRISSNVRRI